MANIIYTLCALTAFLCTVLLLHAYRKSKYRLLLWGGLCFTALTINNVLLVLDQTLLDSYDLSTPRLFAALIGMLMLLYGLIWDKE